jgi:hypothetical protein
MAATMIAAPLLLLAQLGWLAHPAAAAAALRFGVDEGVLDVTAPPFSVDNSGRTDTTAALQAAVAFAHNWSPTCQPAITSSQTPSSATRRSTGIPRTTTRGPAVSPRMFWLASTQALGSAGPASFSQRRRRDSVTQPS